MIAIKVHSISDTITNSSSTLFSYVDPVAVQTTKDIINAIIDAANSTVRADDLFHIFKIGRAHV